MRCQIHIELAKCEEMVEQIEAAVKHLNKALLLDEFGMNVVDKECFYEKKSPRQVL